MRLFVPILLLLVAFSGCARAARTQPAAAPGERVTRTVENSPIPCREAGGTWNARTAYCDNLP